MQAKFRIDEKILPPTRRGAVELAICMPLLVFLVGASVEACELIFLRNSLAAASYAGTLEVSRQGSTEATIRSQITQALDACKVKNYTVSVTSSTGADFNTTARGDLIRIKAEAIVASNLRIGRFIPSSASLITVSALALR